MSQTIERGGEGERGSEGGSEGGREGGREGGGGERQTDRQRDRETKGRERERERGVANRPVGLGFAPSCSLRRSISAAVS